MHERSIAAFEAKKGNPHVFLNQDETEVLGKINFMNIEPHNKNTEFGGTWISPKWQRTHVNTETKYLLLKYCFETLGLVRVEFRIDRENQASRKAIQRIGATFEGIIRNRTILPSEESRDYCFYSVIDKDWPKLKTELEVLLSKYDAPFASRLTEICRLRSSGKFDVAFEGIQKLISEYPAEPLGDFATAIVCLYK